MNLAPIAFARNGFTDKFGIPRQVREHSALRTRIVFCPPFRNPDAIRGISEFSHLWLIWGFHAANRGPQLSAQSCDGESESSGRLIGAGSNGTTRLLHATVRPPRLGGNTRVGVFATRSPFRPNPLGLTSVRLLGVEHSPTEGPVLVVEGADMLDGTPIYDIKPYIGYCDCHPDSRDGFVDTTPRRLLNVVWPDTVPQELPKQELQEILEQDPRPAYQDDPERVYGIDYAGWNIRFTVSSQTLFVTAITSAV